MFRISEFILDGFLFLIDTSIKTTDEIPIIHVLSACSRVYSKESIYNNESVTL
jgi:hypothetical protein